MRTHAKTCANMLKHARRKLEYFSDMLKHANYMLKYSNNMLKHANFAAKYLACFSTC